MQNRTLYLPLADATSPGSTAPPSNSPIRAVAVGVLILTVGVPISFLVRRLCQEWATLRLEETAAASSTVVGYPNIYPIISQASRPQPWRRVEGAELYVWSGWKQGEGHRWFKLISGDCDPAAIGDPMGRDVALSIDFPAVEVGGGKIWERIPESADIVGISIGKIACAYPKAVLAKVLVVNDEVDGVPILLHDDPFMSLRQGDIAVFDPRLDGHRITMGSSGFTLAGRHVLYDRGTESLWIDRGEGLTAFSGKHKGRTLPLVKRLDTTSWGEWQADNPSSRLVIGSLDRTRALPSE